MPFPRLITALLTLSVATAADGPALTVSTSLPIKGRDGAALLFDGKTDTAFRSDRAVRDGDDLTIVLPAPTALTGVEVRSGAAGGGALAFGVLELSEDGERFRHAAVFADGVAVAARLPPKVAAVRVRATGGDGQPLALGEVRLGGLGQLPVRFASRFDIHYETARDSEKFARRAKELCEEWYPKLYEQFDTPEGPAPRSVVKLYFQNMDGVAHATGNEIHISNKWVTKQAPDDYGMVIHELFHIVQAYNGGGEGWLTEGIADYVRHRLFEPQVPPPRIDPDKARYTDAYKTTATFLEWLEDKKKPGIVLALNAASRARRNVREVFVKEAGADVDQLWKEFTDTLRAKP